MHDAKILTQPNITLIFILVKMEDHIDELEEFTLYSEFLEFASKFVVSKNEDWDEVSDFDISNQEISVVEQCLPNEKVEGEETDINILQCIINLIELEHVLQDDCPKKRRKGERRWGVHPLNQLRKEQGHFHNLFEEMLAHDHEKFFNYTRMTPERFQHLFELIEWKITKNAPNAIPPKCRLLLTLR